MAESLPSFPPILRLKGRVQNYAWGNVGSASTVAKLFHADANSPIDESKPYAELWWGTHKTAPADVITAGGQTVPLSSVIASDPTRVLGSKVTQKFTSGLPFLLKVLSINKALSIQAHPDESLAQKLHATFPEHYADPNHKPEIAIALTPFQAMCGFRPENEIIKNITEIPELALILGDSGADLVKGFTKEKLKAAYHALLTADANLVSQQLQQLIKRTEGVHDTLFDSVRQIHRDFPGDVGLFCLFLFNVVTLKPGEALFLAPNEPHAYFKGDCVECMACSDNVVRAGLTPKFKHVDALVDMLTYKCGPADVLRGASSASCPQERLFQVPIPEFEVSVFHLDASSGQADLEISASSGPSILLVTQGSVTLSDSGDSSIEALSLSTGSAAFAYSNTKLRVRADPAGGPATIFRATTNNSIFK